MYQVR